MFSPCLPVSLSRLRSQRRMHYRRHLRRDRGVQERQQQLVMTDQLDAFRCRAVQDVDTVAVLRLLVHRHCHEAVEAVAEIAGHAHSLKENFREHDGGAEIQPDAVLHPAPRR